MPEQGKGQCLRIEIMSAVAFECLIFTHNSFFRAVSRRCRRGLRGLPINGGEEEEAKTNKTHKEEVEDGRGTHKEEVENGRAIPGSGMALAAGEQATAAWSVDSTWPNWHERKPTSE